MGTGGGQTIQTAQIWLSALAVGAICVQTSRADDLTKQLRIFEPAYPRAYFFRACEGQASNPRIPYQRWERTFNRLMGIEGKVLEEEIPGRSERNIGFFTRFKKRHPRQLVLLHYNGNARDPRDNEGAFFAGHWVYRKGSKILSDVPAEPGETEIEVADPILFRVDIGRYRTSKDDVGLCTLDKNGRPNWAKSEQVQLVAVDPKRRVIRVRRGCYGTAPRPFPAGSAYAAAHLTEGPWGKRSNLLWFYNYSTRCPRDANGRTCTDVLVEDLARRFLPGGELAAFDGVEFDVLHHQRFGGIDRSEASGVDCDADGKADGGFFDGVNSYGIGVIEFCRRLRGRLGDGKLILADGMSRNGQRAFGILNGIESEGWPTLGDWDMNDWSGGLNRHGFWQANGRRPVFNYINHKYVTRGPTPGSMRRPEVAYKIHRLVMAAAQFTDSAVCYSWSPPPEQGEHYGIWDELWMGVEHRLGWLGRPLGPAVRLAKTKPDLLRGAGQRMDAQLADRFEGHDVKLAVDAGSLRVSSGDPKARQLRFRLRDVPCDGPDLFVSVAMRGDPINCYPSEMARLTWVGIAEPKGKLVTAELPYVGMKIRGQTERTADPTTGAVLRLFKNRRLGDQAHDAYLLHPPYKAGVGHTYWQRDVLVPRAGRLEFFLGMGEKAPGRSDGVVFRVEVAELANGQPGSFTSIFTATQIDSRWTAYSVPLTKWAGRHVRLRFVSDCGPNDNATTDHSHWGDVKVVGPDDAASHTEPMRFMTWTHARPFTSGFYFPHVRSKTVDLAFTVEGREPVWISDLTVHAHPDAIYRRFERGLVLANPARHSYTFELDKLAPGEQFRRLRGSSRQDTKANGGSIVPNKLTLADKEGLFLVKVRP